MEKDINRIKVILAEKKRTNKWLADLMQYSKVPADLISKFSLEVYSEPVDAAFKALGIR